MIDYSNENGGACVEVAGMPDGGRAVRDTKDHGNGPILQFTEADWQAFVSGARVDAFH
jgi:hypothetical protein